ncbi:MAG: hypothetical protein NT116_03550, partial [Candidatus Parcubacteria bacterium]|nr:hypothetical protein [Candidatus Parcubacteria bacterium]
MLSLRARREIFGIAFESVFEAGDALAILKDLQHDDWNLAVFAFRVKWEKILKILINLNAWIIGEEANELIAHFMNYYKIFNYEIWEEVINTDQTLHIWHVNYREEYQSQKERFYSEETSLKSSEKSETEKQKLIRAIFSALMIDTPVIQND